MFRFHLLTIFPSIILYNLVHISMPQNVSNHVPLSCYYYSKYDFSVIIYFFEHAIVRRCIQLTRYILQSSPASYFKTLKTNNTSYCGGSWNNDDSHSLLRSDGKPKWNSWMQFFERRITFLYLKISGDFYTC